MSFAPMPSNNPLRQAIAQLPGACWQAKNDPTLMGPEIGLWPDSYDLSKYNRDIPLGEYLLGSHPSAPHDLFINCSSEQYLLLWQDIKYILKDHPDSECNYTGLFGDCGSLSWDKDPIYGKPMKIKSFTQVSTGIGTPGKGGYIAPGSYVAMLDNGDVWVAPTRNTRFVLQKSASGSKNVPPPPPPPPPGVTSNDACALWCTQSGGCEAAWMDDEKRGNITCKNGDWFRTPPGGGIYSYELMGNLGGLKNMPKDPPKAPGTIKTSGGGGSRPSPSVPPISLVLKGPGMDLGEKPGGTTSSGYGTPPCPSGLQWNTELGKCTCPSGYRWEASMGKCIPKPSEDKPTQPPAKQMSLVDILSKYNLWEAYSKFQMGIPASQSGLPANLSQLAPLVEPYSPGFANWLSVLGAKPKSNWGSPPPPSDTSSGKAGGSTSPMGISSRRSARVVDTQFVDEDNGEVFFEETQEDAEVYSLIYSTPTLP